MKRETAAVHHAIYHFLRVMGTRPPDRKLGQSPPLLMRSLSLLFPVESLPLPCFLFSLSLNWIWIWSIDFFSSLRSLHSTDKWIDGTHHHFCGISWDSIDTFASKVAAVNDKYADSSIGNVTGSNAVNVFLGIGIAWTLAAIVHWFRGTTFYVDPGSLAFSVTLFCICAAICCSTLLIRRYRVGGELGGPFGIKVATAILLSGLWVFYVLMSALEAYGIIQGF